MLLSDIYTTERNRAERNRTGPRHGRHSTPTHSPTSHTCPLPGARAFFRHPRPQVLVPTDDTPRPHRPTFTSDTHVASRLLRLRPARASAAPRGAARVPAFHRLPRSLPLPHSPPSRLLYTHARAHARAGRHPLHTSPLTHSPTHFHFHTHSFTRPHPPGTPSTPP